MCNWEDEARKMSQKLGGMSLEQSFPPEFIAHRAPSSVIQGHCLVCNKILNHHEMYPSGRPPRYMCRPCYEQAAYSDPYHCLWCNAALPHHQVQMRIANPRELKDAFCAGACLDYHKILAGLVLGIPFNYNHHLSIGHQRQSLPYKNPAAAIPYTGLGWSTPNFSAREDLSQKSRGEVVFLPLPTRRKN